MVLLLIVISPRVRRMGQFNPDYRQLTVREGGKLNGPVVTVRELSDQIIAKRDETTVTSNPTTHRFWIREVRVASIRDTAVI